MKITFALSSLYGGGVQRVTLRLIQALLGRSIPVALVVLNGEGPLKAEIPAGCEFTDLGRSRVRFAWSPLWKYLREQQPEVIISSQTHLNVLLIVLRWFARLPKYLIVCEHIVFNPSITKDRRFVERLRPYLIRVCYPLASAILSVSRESAESIRSFWPSAPDIEVIPNGVDVSEIERQRREPADHPWLQQGELRVVLGMGRLAPQKNFELLLRAFALLADAQYTRLIILGDGPDLNILMRLAESLGISDRVDFPGFIQNPYPFLGQADLFVLSSKWEGFANVVIEALACGLPIVATDCPGGPSEMLRGRTFATIVPLDDAAAMAEALHLQLRTVHDPTLIRESVIPYQINNIAALYLDLVNRLVNQD